MPHHPCFNHTPMSFFSSHSIQGRPNQTDLSMGPKPGGPPGAGPGPGAPTQPQGPGQGQAARRNLQVDVGSSKGGHPVSPGSSAPTSPYSLPQIAPMPSSKLCPVCKTADLTGTTDGQPNCNTCTQCHSTVCNQCGFNPNPHLTKVSSPGHAQSTVYVVQHRSKVCPQYGSFIKK